jgi:excisionase family DNA binding protein
MSPKQSVVEESPVWTIPEAARYLKVPIYTVRLMIRRGQLSYQRLGKKFILPISEVKAILAAGWKREGVAA